MTERIAQFAAFVDRTGAFRRRMAGNTAGKRKLQEQLLQPGFILADVGVDFAVRAFKVSVAHHRRPAVSGAGDVEHIEVVLLDNAVQMHVNEVLSGRCTPMPQ